MNLEYWLPIASSPIVTAILLAIYSNKSSKELEKIKKDFNQSLYIFQKEHDKKFEVKIELWNKLAELEGYVDDLWMRNKGVDQSKANRALREATINLRKSQIFINDNLYQEIKEVLEIFKRYTKGKESLNQGIVENYSEPRHEIHEIIQRNLNNKEAYTNMLNRLKDEILKQNS